MLVQKVIPFATPIWHFNIGDAFNNEIDVCYTYAANFAPVKNSNVGGYQSPEINLDNYFLAIKSKLVDIVKEIANDVGTDFIFDNAWININKKGDFNAPHYHPNAAFSGVVYLKTSLNSGLIRFNNPVMIGAFPITDKVDGFWSNYFFVPKVGDVLIFPAYLNHHVEPNLSDEDRISIAFNLK